MKPILIADHFPREAAAVESALKKAGVKNSLFCVHIGAEVIEFLKGEGVYADRKQFPFPSVLLLDMELTGVDGFGVLEWIQRQQKLPPLLVVVMCNSHSTNEITREISHAYGLGASSFLFKPINPVDLKNLIKWFPEPWITAGPPEACERHLCDGC